MIKINKKEPGFYSDYIAKIKPRTWFDVSKEIGNQSREYMLDNEQHNQCAYTGKNIRQDNSHIDHFTKQEFIKQGLAATTLFDWDNLLASCNSEFYGAKFKDKNITYDDYKNLINPVVDNPSDFFEYSFTGMIIPQNNNLKALKTIELFNLNDYELIKERKAIAMQVKSIYNQFDIDEIVEIIGKFEGFIRHIYKDLVEMN